MREECSIFYPEKAPSDYCLYANFSKKEVHRQVTTDVYFNHLSEQLIEDYLATGSCLDKAGAYGIQDQDFPLVHHISGSYSNVMGLPLEMLEKDLKDF